MLWRLTAAEGAATGAALVGNLAFFVSQVEIEAAMTWQGRLSVQQLLARRLQVPFLSGSSLFEDSTLKED